MTLEELHKYVEEAHTDVTFDYRGKVVILYTDGANANVDTDDFDFHHFDTWEELCKSDYFWGRTLGEIAQELVPYE